jgi:hypothetical protein
MSLYLDFMCLKIFAKCWDLFCAHSSVHLELDRIVFPSDGELLRLQFRVQHGSSWSKSSLKLKNFWWYYSHCLEFHSHGLHSIPWVWRAQSRYSSTDAPPPALVTDLNISYKLFKTLEINFYFCVTENRNISCYKIEAGPAILQNYSGVIGRSWYRNTCHVTINTPCTNFVDILSMVLHDVVLALSTSTFQDCNHVPQFKYKPQYLSAMWERRPTAGGPSSQSSDWAQIYSQCPFNTWYLGKNLIEDSWYSQTGFQVSEHLVSNHCVNKWKKLHSYRTTRCVKTIVLLVSVNM